MPNQIITDAPDAQVTISGTADDTANAAIGATTDAAVPTDAPGTISGKLRGIVAHLVSLIANAGATNSAAITTDADGTISGKLRGLVKIQAGLFAQKVTTPDANITYIAKAPIGTAQATAGWQCQKVVVSGNDTVTTWADGNSDFDNVATDLTALTYS